VTESAAHPRVFEKKWRKRYLSSTIFPLGFYVEERTAPKGKLGAGGSVTTSAWDFARLLGANPIYVAGLDLGFPGRATHAKDSYFEKRALSRTARLKPAELESYLALTSANPSLMPDNSGGRVLSDQRMVLYSWWFEAKLQEYPEARTFNLSPYGLAIKGMPLASLSDILALPQRRAEIDARVQAACETPPATEPGFRAAYAGLLKGIGDLALAARQAKEVSRNAMMKLDAGGEIRSELQRLSDLDAALMANDAKEIVSFLFPNIEELTGASAHNLREALQKGEAVYAEAEALADYHLKALNRAKL
jgi:hypothetical protein